jgi:hypothetical protein
MGREDDGVTLREWESGTDALSIDQTLKKCEILYTQACFDARVMIDLRFKHFTTYMVAQAFLVIAALRDNAFAIPHWVATTIGIALTILFWQLDCRTAAYHDAFRRRAEEIETRLGSVELRIAKGRLSLSGRQVSQAIFLIFGLCWAAGTVLYAVVT